MIPFDPLIILLFILKSEFIRQIQYSTIFLREQYYILNNLYVNLSIKYVDLHKTVVFFAIPLKIRMMIFILFYVMMQVPAARPAHTVIYSRKISSEVKMQIPRCQVLQAQYLWHGLRFLRMPCLQRPLQFSPKGV